MAAPATERPAGTDAEGMRDVACLFCGVHEEKLRFRDGIYRVVECGRCGHVYVNPRLPRSRLHDMYQEEYWRSDRARDFGYSQYLDEKELYLRTYGLRSRLVDEHVPRPGRVLDVGCAAGFFLKVMADKGWRTTGVEISQPMVSYAREELGLPDVRVGDLLSVDLEPGSFDVITLWDVIEHLERPDRHLARAVELLADDGILVIETQDVGSRFARALGRKWHHYKHEEHLHHFHRDSLQRLLAGAGAEVVENTPRRGGKYISMHFVTERVGRIHPLLSVLAAPLRLLSRLHFYVNLYDEMVVVARKA